MSGGVHQFYAYKITLMRHGAPLLPKQGWIAPREMERWITAYNQAEIVAEKAPDTCLQMALSAACIVSSPAPRALTTVHALGHEADEVSDLFNEAALPAANWGFPRLPAQVWAAWFRALWFLGYVRDVESVDAARRRAAVAARRLADLSLQGEVLVVGHGIMNRLIGAELAALGWVAETAGGHGYWGHATYNASARAIHAAIAGKQAHGGMD